MKKLIALFLCFSVISCQNIRDRVELENYNYSYQGNWIANYYGAENGKFTLQVSNTGNVFGLRNNTDYLGGKVYDGGVLMNLHSPTSNFQIQGNLEQKSGTWIMENKSGTWTIEKL